MDSTDYGGYVNTTTYQYDVLKRLTSAAAVPTQNNYGPTYTQTFDYDGFGNLTAKVLNGTTTSIAVNATTNQLTHAYYDANGNMTSGTGATFTFDEANRIATAQETSGGEEYYGYEAANKRIYRMDANQREWFTFYGAMGENLGKYQMASVNNYPCNTTCFGPAETNVWFAGRLVTAAGGSSNGNGTVPLMYPDRLGSNRYVTGIYYPYGEGGAGTDNVLFATYTRDSYTGNDYADQRFYASTYGRYLTPDPAGAKAAKSGDPVSWNRYSYTRGDPVNRVDPRGLDDSGYDCAVIFADASLAYNPNSYCSGAPGNCPDPVMAMALADSPDSVTFYAQAMASGCSPYGAPIIPAAAPAPALPDLTMVVGYTPTVNLGGGRNSYDHLFIWIYVAGNPLAGVVFDGGPTGNCGQGQCGDVAAWSTTTGFYNEVTNPAAVAISTTQLGFSQAEQDLETLYSDTAAIEVAEPNNPYNGFTGPNSNSVVYSELQSIGYGVPISMANLPFLGNVGVLNYQVNGQTQLFTGWGQNLLP